MLEGFDSVAFNDAAAIREAAAGDDVAAVLIEPIQGEAGINPVSDEALLAAREGCDESGALLILDEIQTGIGRTGSLWAYRADPGAPRRAYDRQGAGRRDADRRLRDDPRRRRGARAGDHGSTFAGGPVAARAARRGARGGR